VGVQVLRLGVQQHRVHTVEPLHTPHLSDSFYRSIRTP
jgi:hypothetical protein